LRPREKAAERQVTAVWQPSCPWTVLLRPQARLPTLFSCLLLSFQRSHVKGYRDQPIRHGDAKTWHGLARAVRRGLANMKIQAYLTAAAINLKRLAALSLLVLRWMIPWESVCDSLIAFPWRP
jgi:hypothetical protein